MAYGDAGEGKWRGNWRMELVASTLTVPRNVVYPALLPLMRTPRLPGVDWTDAPADLNGLVRFGERRNLVSARVPSRFKRAIQRHINLHVWGGGCRQSVTGVMFLVLALYKTFTIFAILRQLGLYIYICVCVCVCVCFPWGPSTRFRVMASPYGVSWSPVVIHV